MTGSTRKDALSPGGNRGSGNLSVIAFHEKAGRSQVNCCFILLETFSFLARSPLSPCFHPHSRGAIVSLGASWASSVQPVLPSVWRPVVLLG